MSAFGAIADIADLPLSMSARPEPRGLRAGGAAGRALSGARGLLGGVSVRLWRKGTAKTQEVAVRVFDCEFPKPIGHVFGTPFGLTVFLYSVPQRINIIDGKILRRRSVGRSKVRVVHKHDGNAVTAEAAPPIRLARSPES